MSKSYDDQLAFDELLKQAKQKTLKRAIGFAMGQENFDAQECLVYLGLCFREDNPEGFKACASWLSKHGALSDVEAKSWAIKSFYEQKPYALATIAHAFPSTLEQEYDGVDIWMTGLAMSLIYADEPSAVMLAHALGRSDQSDARLHQSIAQAYDLVDHHYVFNLEPDKKLTDVQTLLLVAAKCEQAFLTATVAHAKSKGTRAMAL
jgi:hypothetical protein